MQNNSNTSVLSKVSSSKSKNNSIINNWNNLLIREILDYWIRDDNIELPTFEEFEIALGIGDQNWINFLIGAESDKPNLLGELKLRVNHVSLRSQEKDTDLTTKVKYIERVTSSWFFGNQAREGYMPCLLKLENNAQQLRINLNNKLKLFINSCLTQVPPQTRLEYLEKLESQLKKLIYRLEHSQLDYQLQEESATNAHQWLLKACEDYSAHVRAVFYIYNYKIKIQVCSLAIQALSGVIEIIQLHIDKLIQAIALLRRVKNKYSNNLEQRYVLKTQIFLPLLFEEMCLDFTPEDLMNKLEFKFGSKIVDWGVIGTITEEQIEDFLLEHVNSISSQLYDQVKRDFLVI